MTEPNLAGTTADGVDYLRTPDERFAAVADFPYEPHYLDVDGLRMAYVVDGAAATETVLLLHGEPTWGYLHRHMIPILAAAGHRVVVPDLIGFGRSDKPTDRSSYTYAGHVAWMKTFVDQLGAEIDLDSGPLHLFGQDWGGLIGLRLAAENTDLFDRLILANTGLPVGQSLGPGFDFWRRLSQELAFIDSGRLVDNTATLELPAEAIDAYRAPFPDERYMAGAREFPLLVPITPDDPAVPANIAAWRVLEQWTKPVLTLWAPGDQVLGHLGADFIDRIPGARNQPHAQFEPSGHFIQEEQGPAVAEAIVAWLADARLG